MAKTKKIYLASSWRNEYQPSYVEWLRQLAVPNVRKLEVYDFRNPMQYGAKLSEINTGFSWSQISILWALWTTAEYVKALETPLAAAGFASDFDAMKWADTCIFLMPCGNSASMELGYMAGAGKKTIVHFPESHTTPDLMVKMATHITTNFTELYRALAE